MKRPRLKEIIGEAYKEGLNREQAKERARETKLYAESSIGSEVSRVFVREKRERRNGAGRHPVRLSPEEQKTYRDIESRHGNRTHQLLQRLVRYAVRIEFPLTVGEIDDDPTYSEGAKEWVLANRFERNRKAIAACKEHHGVKCCICRMRFEDVYGIKAKGFIQVHHLTPLSKIGKRYSVNPKEDLCPVCPNCHAVIHMRKPLPFTPEEVRAMLK